MEEDKIINFLKSSKYTDSDNATAIGPIAISLCGLMNYNTNKYSCNKKAYDLLCSLEEKGIVKAIRLYPAMLNISINEKFERTQWYLA